jgi:hypothetical protein
MPFDSQVHLLESRAVPYRQHGRCSGYFRADVETGVHVGSGS